jgi:iron complex transport system ATP-binding protein
MPSPGPTASAGAPVARAALDIRGVDLDRGGNRVLRGITWRVEQGQRWAVLGPNGSGKTTLVQLAAGYLHPTRGAVDVLGETLGRTDVRALRERVAIVSSGVARRVLPWLCAREVVVSARHGALEPWWHSYDAQEQERAVSLLATAGFEHVAERRFGDLSEGERQQVLLARALMSSPELLLLDEPCAGLDMGGRERLLARLTALASDDPSLPVVLVTHHVEEIPAGFGHLLLLKQGRCLVSGPTEEVLSAEALTTCFGIPLSLRHDSGRWASRLAGPAIVAEAQAP